MLVCTESSYSLSLALALNNAHGTRSGSLIKVDQAIGTLSFSAWRLGRLGIVTERSPFS